MKKAILGIITVVLALGAALIFIQTKSETAEAPLVRETGETPRETREEISGMKLESTAFEHGGTIPKKYTCDGENVSPPLTISNASEGAKSLVLIMDDPDVPKTIRPDGLFVHWVVWKMSPSTTEIKERESPGSEGQNTTGDTGYTGPCPPDREHRYFFKLYALDTELEFPNESGGGPAPTAPATKEQIVSAMAGHIIEEAELMGRYDRAR